MFKKKDKATESLEKLKRRIESQADVKPAETEKPKKSKAAQVEQPVEPVIEKSSTKNDLAQELEFEKQRNQQERDNKIPGYGWLFGIDERFLPESTVLDRGEVLSFALGNMQENMLNPNRTESLFALFAKDIMRMNISVKGLAREQALMARQQDADKGATMNTLRDLTGRPGAL
jgi:hypothetical protein